MNGNDFCLFSDFQILKALFPWLTAANWKFLKTTVRTALNLTAINQEMGQPGPIIVASLTAVDFFPRVICLYHAGNPFPCLLQRFLDGQLISKSDLPLESA